MNEIEITDYVNELFNKYNLYDWSFNFDNAKRRFGLCSYRRKLITISKPLSMVNKKEIIIDTILHEIAHAIIGSGYGHNHIWVRKALEIGCSGKRCYGREVITPSKKWIATCPNCKRVIERHRKINTLACGRCCKRYCNNRYDDNYKFNWKIK
jgi:hypothetical protein